MKIIHRGHEITVNRRAVGMAYPRSTNEELLSMARDASALAEFAQTVVEFGRRVEYAMRRYQRNGRFDEVTP